MAIIKRKNKDTEKRKRDTTRHDNLVSAAAKWLKNSCGCPVVMKSPFAGIAQAKRQMR